MVSIIVTSILFELRKELASCLFDLRETLKEVKRFTCVKSPHFSSSPASTRAAALGVLHTDIQCLPIPELLIVSTFGDGKTGRGGGGLGTF